MWGTMRLSDLYPTLKPAEREALAAKAGTKSVYLYQLATRFRGKKPSLKLLMALAGADPRLTLADMAEEFDEDPAQRVPEQAEPNGA